VNVYPSIFFLSWSNIQLTEKAFRNGQT